MAVVFDKSLQMLLNHDHTTELDSRYVNVTGDSMTGALTIAGSSDTVKLIVKGSASQSENMIEGQTSAGGVLFSVDARGAYISNITTTNTSGTGYAGRAINTANPTAPTTANFYSFFPSINYNSDFGTTGTVSSSLNQLNINSSGTFSNIAGAWTNVVVGSGETATITNVYGYSLNAYTLEDATVTSAVGIRSRMASIDTGSITNSYGYFLVAATIGAGSITNQYGIFLPAITGATTINDAIKTNGGLVDFSDTVGQTLRLTRVDASVTANDMVGKIEFSAKDTSTTTNLIVANIEAQATNTVTTDINPGRLIFRTTGTAVAATPTERMRIDENGRVGIGTNAPEELLHLETSDFCTLRFDALTDEGMFYADGVFHFVVMGSRSATDVRLIRGGTQRMDFSATENVLNDNAASIDTRIEGATDANLLVAKASTDRVGVGTNAPNSKLDVVGTVQADGLRLDLTPTAETVTPTHTITVSIAGTNYKIPIVAA